MSLPVAPEGYIWDLDLYSEKEDDWILVKKYIEDPIELAERRLSKFETLDGWIMWNRPGIWNLTNLESLKTWGNIPQTTSAKPRALTFYSKDPSSLLTHSIFGNPHILEDTDIYHLKNSFQTMTITTSEQLRDFVRDFQKLSFIPLTPEEMIVSLGLLCIAPYKEITYSDLPDLYKVNHIQWKKVQDAGFYGWFIDPSLHAEALQYHWYREINSPIGFVWDIRAFPNPTEDLIRIPFD